MFMNITWLYDEFILWKIEGDTKRSLDHIYYSLMAAATSAYSSTAFPMKNVHLAEWESACGQYLWLLPCPPDLPHSDHSYFLKAQQ